MSRADRNPWLAKMSVCKHRLILSIAKFEICEHSSAALTGPYLLQL